MIQKSHDDRMLWAQFDALEMGSGWEDTDILRPQIMVESVYGDSHPGSTHLNQMVEQAVYGVYQCGGKPAKYYATDICDGCAQGHDGMNVVLASREAIANMVEVHASAVPWDGIILASSCDKSIPAHLKAAARMNVPTIFMPGGSMRPGPNQTTSLVAGDISLRQKRKDAITEQEVRDYKLTGCPSVGACTFLGTASTMQCVAEALGMTLPGAALVPATMRDLLQYARYAGRKIMELVEKNITPSQIMTPAAFRNAIIVHSAIGGSTNATIHLPSIARELGYDLPIELFDEINHQVPPPGQHQSLRQAPDRVLLVRRRRAHGAVDAPRHAGSGRDDRHRQDPGREPGGPAQGQLVQPQPGLPGQLRPDPRPGDLPRGEGPREGLRGHSEGQHRPRGLRAEVLRLRHEPARGGSTPWPACSTPRRTPTTP